MNYYYDNIPKLTLEYAKGVYLFYTKYLENLKDLEDYAYRILSCLNILLSYSEEENIKNDVSYQEFKEYVYRKKLELEPIYSRKHSDDYYNCDSCSDGMCVRYYIDMQYNQIYNNRE